VPDSEQEGLGRRGARGLRSDIHGFVDASMPAMLAELTEWVRIRSVAGTPDTRTKLAASAQWLAQRFRDIGFPIVDVLPTGDSFAVYAEWCTQPAAPTYLIYSHHDVRSAEPSWALTEGFTPLLKENRLFGRGRCRPVLGHRAMGRRTAGTSIRGMISAHLQLRTAEHDIHSGAVSGPAPNPIVDLSAFLTRLHDEQGRRTRWNSTIKFHRWDAWGMRAAARRASVPNAGRAGPLLRYGPGPGQLA
jgi:acetylornithine deacetylase/succinyl-diaminopimelate desuccinylase-like protein